MVWDPWETPTVSTASADECNSTDPSCYQGVQSILLEVAVDLQDLRAQPEEKQIGSRFLRLLGTFHVEHRSAAKSLAVVSWRSQAGHLQKQDGLEAKDR